MSKTIKLIAILLICAVLLPAAGSSFPSASAAPLATTPVGLGTAAISRFWPDRQSTTPLRLLSLGMLV